MKTGTGFDQIAKAIRAHTRDLGVVEMFSPRWYFAKTMIERGKRAMNMECGNAAYRFFIGA